MSRRRMARWTGFGAGAAALASALFTGCFSEHPEGITGLSDACAEVARAANIPSNHVIVGIENHAFTPANVTIARGQTVTWVNCESQNIRHTATADDGSWESPLFGPPQTYSRTFSAAGNNPYFCEPHPFMTGTVVVS